MDHSGPAWHKLAMMLERLVIAGLMAIAAMVAAGPLQAQEPANRPVELGPVSFDAYLQLLIARARAEGVSEATIQRMTQGLTPNDRVIRLDRAQPGTPSNSGFPPVSDYIATHVNDARIAGGREVYSENRPTLLAVEQEYGVPASVIVAIFGHETSYGRVKGNFDLARSLSTLAWEGRRRELFAKEFIALLKVADRGYERKELVGSWAGAFGNPQFLPSIYLKLARDGDGDGRANIFSSRADTFASIGNYLRYAGWRKGQPWGVRAMIPSGFDWRSVETKLVSPVCPRVHVRHSQWKTVAEWRALGVQPQKVLGDKVLASLFQPDGPGTSAWLLTSNYRAILEYNCSNYYAMSVGLLADEIAR